MKAWILIGFYLLKDIWRRWFETPGGVLSRLLVAFLLALLLLVIDAAFTLSAASIQGKISKMGIRTIVLSRSVTPAEAEADTGYLARLVAPLGDRGTILRLMQTGAYGEDELGTRRTIYLYGEEMRGDLTSALPPTAGTGAFMVSEKLPPGMATPISIDQGPEIEATAMAAPTWLEKFGANSSAAFLPAENFPELTEKGFFELVVFLGDEGSDLLQIEADLTTMFALENLVGIQLTSPRELLSQLDGLENTQRKWRTGFGLFGGMAVSLVFGSIAVLEYRQNRFIIALLKSFGTPPVLLVARYLLEALLLVAISALLARGAAIWLHPVIFGALGMEPHLLDRDILDPYLWSVIRPQFRWLGLGAVLSVVPIAFAMRTPVGRILA